MSLASVPHDTAVLTKSHETSNKQDDEWIDKMNNMNNVDEND